MTILKLFLSMLFCSTLLTSCGFKLRGSGHDFYNFDIKSIKIVGSLSPAIKEMLDQQLNLYNIKTIENSQSNNYKPDAIIEIKESISETINGLNNKGKASEIRLKYSVNLIIRSGKQDDILQAPQNIEQFRDISTNDSVSLAKEQEKQQLIKNMQQAITISVVEKIKRIKLL
jgi:outer membrane lipopolysaccharide assembly protein LptE/RlpB